MKKIENKLFNQYMNDYYGRDWKKNCTKSEIADKKADFLLVRNHTLKNMWIDIFDAYPPDDINVLLLIDESIPMIGLGKNVRSQDLNVTHWMYIPELSEE